MSEEMGGGYTLDDIFFVKLKRKEDKKDAYC